jgi:hypothetical protein
MRNPTEGLRKMTEQLDYLSEVFGEDFWNQIRSTATTPGRAPAPERTAAPQPAAERKDTTGPPADLSSKPGFRPRAPTRFRSGQNALQVTALVRSPCRSPCGTKPLRLSMSTAFSNCA